MILRLATLFLMATAAAMGSIARHRRSVAPFLGAGGSRPKGMLIAPELWHCGSDGGSHNYSYHVASTDCPSLAAAMNHCCAVHDDCYGQQAGQDKCDNEFCECNRMVARIPTGEGYKCRAFTEDACMILGIAGMFAYGGSNYNDPLKPSANILTTLKTAPEMKQDYLDLYSHCPFVNITLASCATNFDLCALVHSVDFCANDLCHCMLDASEADTAHKVKCSQSVAHMCRLVLKHSSDVLSSRSFIRNVIIVSLILVASASVAFCVFFMYSKVNSDRNKCEDGKYLHIHTVESSRSVNPLLNNVD